MNYRHIYHVGNICDVVKHAVLTLLIGHLRAKETAFAVLDSHAGVGLYDLNDERAQKTQEAELGVRKLLAALPIADLADYYRVVNELNTDGSLRFYPGSPILIKRLLRPQDRLMVCELHAEDGQALKQQFHHDKQVQVHHRDAYEALKALLPPAEKRGLAFIDPPFETPDEFNHLVEAIEGLHRVWPQGQVVIWYPIKERPAIWRFHEMLVNASIPKMLCAEFIYTEETRSDRLNGCGFIFVNAPWRLDKQLENLFPQLHQALETEFQNYSVKWLAS